MIILDTDHLTILQVPENRRRDQLVSRMALSTDTTFAATIISVEEQMRGWLSSIAKERIVARQVFAYHELEQLFDFFGGFQIASFDSPAADQLEDLSKQKIRIGTMDLKIASIALATNSLLLTANRRDFEKVPGLKFENWIE